jgi:hypothetical protein
MQLRRGLALSAIVLVVAAFVAIGVVAALVAGREVSRLHPTPTPSPTPGSTAAAIR